MPSERYRLTAESIRAMERSGKSKYRISVESDAKHRTIADAMDGKPFTVETKERLEQYMPDLTFEYLGMVEYRGHAARNRAKDDEPCGIEYVMRILPGYLDGGGEIAIHTYQDALQSRNDDGRWVL